MARLVSRRRWRDRLWRLVLSVSVIVAFMPDGIDDREVICMALIAATAGIDVADAVFRHKLMSRLRRRRREEDVGK